MRIMCYNCRRFFPEKKMEPFRYLLNRPEGPEVIERNTCPSCIVQIYGEPPKGWTKCFRCRRFTLEEPQIPDQRRKMLNVKYTVRGSEVRKEEPIDMGEAILCIGCLKEERRGVVRANTEKPRER